MCGVAGIVDPSLSAHAVETVLQRMNTAIVHRGPDDKGSYASDGFGIGMRRLSIIDVTGGQQPLSDVSGQIQVVCNGEIYNHRQLREHLEKRGHVFQTRSDAEVIVHLYREYGDRFLSHLRGMFALAVLDAPGRRVLVARDRLGKKPLFYAQRGDKFLFASEIKSLLAVEPSLAEPDYSLLAHYFQFGFIGEPRTIYRQISKLPAAHYGIYENGSLAIQPYWQVQFDPDDSLTAQQWTEQLDEAILESVRLRLESEVPLGVFLSGGLDSSAIVAYAHRAGLNPLKTFTIGFQSDQWDESGDAQRIADHFGTQHHNLTIRRDDLLDGFEDTLNTLVGHFDEPFGDDSALPTYHVSRLAREHVTVILSGDGGDELFAGYSSYQGAAFGRRYRQWVPSWLASHGIPGAAGAMRHVLPGTWKHKADRASKVLRDSALPFLESYRDKISIWSARQINELLDPDVYNQCDYTGSRYLPDHLWKLLHQPRDLTSRLTEQDLRWYLLDDVLVKVDRMSMAHSLEVRCPLLDHRLVELAARMPSHMKLRRWTGKYVLRRVMQNQLPKQIMRKPKQGFGVPLRDWMRGPLMQLIREHVDPKSGMLPAGMFNHGHIDQVLRQHASGSHDHSRRIWLLLVFAVWHRKYQEGSQ